MKLHYALLAAVAIGAVIAPSAQAAEKKHAKHHSAVPVAKSAEEGLLKSEVEELKAQVSALREEIKAQHDTTAATQAQVAQTQAQVGEMHQEIAAKPVVTKAEVKTEIASAVEAEKHRDNIPYKGIKITPGGFLEMAGMYRQHFQGNDMPTSWAIPFPSAHNYYTGESRFSARQSRLSLLAQGKPNEHTTLTM